MSNKKTDILLLDFDYYLNHLKPIENKNFFKNFPTGDQFNNIGILLELPPGLKEKMIILPQEHRLDFILSDNFLKSIIDYDYIICNKTKKTITLNCCSFIIDNLDHIINCLFENLPHNFKIIFSINLEIYQNLENFTSIVDSICTKFSYPVLSGLENKIYFYRLNDFNNTINCKTTKILVSKMLNEMKELKNRNNEAVINCSVRVKLTDSAIKKLKLLTSKIFESQNHFEGLEISDKFSIGEISSGDDGKVLVTLCINEKDSKVGEDDSVDVVFSKYTYHTHPKKTYDKFEVLYAWPSWQDFESFLILFKSGITIFHITATLEGAYITTINPRIFPYLSTWNFDDITEIIKENYDWMYPSYDIERKHQNHLHPKDGFDFCNQINTKEIEFNKELFPPIFNVKLIPWNEFSENNIFDVEYISGNNQTCSISDLSSTANL